MYNVYLDIVMSLPSTLDYITFDSICKARDLPTLDILEFTRYHVAIVNTRFHYPGITDEELIAILKQPEESRGLGDTIAKITEATGLDKLSEIYTQITGKDCGCKSRQEALNKLFPYGAQGESNG